MQSNNYCSICFSIQTIFMWKINHLASRNIRWGIWNAYLVFGRISSEFWYHRVRGSQVLFLCEKAQANVWNGVREQHGTVFELAFSNKHLRVKYNAHFAADYRNKGRMTLFSAWSCSRKYTDQFSSYYERYLILFIIMLFPKVISSNIVHRISSKNKNIVQRSLLPIKFVL
jgi:hypothetical protein